MSRVRPTRMRRILLAGVVACSALVLVPAPSYACSCVTATDVEHLDRADVVVTGTLVDVDLASAPADKVVYVVAVDRLYKGEAPETLRVRSSASGASCGLEGMVADRRYLLFLEGTGEDFRANLCGGTRAVADQPIRVVGSEGFPVAEPEAEPREPLPEVGAGEMVAADHAAPVALVSGGLLFVIVGLLWWRLSRS